MHHGERAGGVTVERRRFGDDGELEDAALLGGAIGFLGVSRQGRGEQSERDSRGQSVTSVQFHSRSPPMHT